MSSESSVVSSGSSAMSSSSSVERASDPAQSKSSTAKHQFEIDHDLSFQGFVFLHDNIHIVSGTWFGAIYKWNCDTGLLVGEPWVREGAGECVLVLSPDGKTIACGRNDGSIQRWNTDGEMIEGIWAAQSGAALLLLAWSPSGSNIAYRTRDGKILILKAENGEVEVGPIGLDGKYVRLDTLAYSPSGDRIASGGQYTTTCIWDSNTGELLVRLEDFRVTRSNSLLWDTESHQPLSGQLHPPLERSPSPATPFEYCYFAHQVSFSRDGRYLASSMGRNKISLWMVKDIAPKLPLTSLLCLDVDATKPSAQSEGDGDVYDDFFRSSDPSLSRPYTPHGPSHPSEPFHPSRARRMWNTLIPFRHRPPSNESIPPHPLSDRSVFSWRPGPRPITVSAGRPRRLYWMVPRPVLPANQTVEEGNGNGNGNGNTNPSTAQLPSAATRPQPTPHNPQHSQTQAMTQPAEKNHDFGCWGNFCLAVGCIPPVVPAAQSTSS
ncbi:tricorn protease domain 2-containing protein [Rhizopogon salebrosus TDB-379]|nr:tricorn protease domain 2-containing protein [Rhizopogon salebrosus TDB-379]